MSEEQDEIWNRQDGEETLWYERFLSYLRMGPARSLLGAVHLEEAQKSAEKRSFSVPGAWFDAFKRHEWHNRADAYDDYRRRTVFTQGNAYDLHRIERLDKLATMLEERVTKMLEQLPKNPKKKWFNNFMYQAYLDTQDAIAQETGGRVKKNEVAINEIPIKRIGVYPGENGCEP